MGFEVPILFALIVAEPAYDVEPALRAHLCHRHHHPGLRRVAERLRRADKVIMPLSSKDLCVAPVFVTR